MKNQNQQIRLQLKCLDPGFKKPACYTAIILNAAEINI